MAGQKGKKRLLGKVYSFLAENRKGDGLRKRGEREDCWLLARLFGNLVEEHFSVLSLVRANSSPVVHGTGCNSLVCLLQERCFSCHPVALLWLEEFDLPLFWKEPCLSSLPHGRLDTWRYFAQRVPYVLCSTTGR